MATQTRTMRTKPRIELENILTALAYAILILWAVAALFPIYWMVKNSIEPSKNIAVFPPNLLPTKVTLINYFDVMRRFPIPRWFLNTLIVASVRTAGAIVFGAMAGYAFAKLKFWGREVLFWALMSVIMIPGFITIIPLYQLIRAFGLIDTIWAVILPGVTGGIGAMFLMRQVMRTLPTEIIESGRIDGSGEFRIFWELIMPLAKPGLAVLGIFHFVGNWNWFLWPLIVLRAKEKFLLASGLGLLASPKDTGMGSMTGVLFVGQVMAGACIQAVPIIIVFLLFQQYFLKGITIGAIKG